MEHRKSKSTNSKPTDKEKTYFVLPDKTKNMKNGREVAKPMHYRRIQRALNIKHFNNSLAAQELSESDENEDNENGYLNELNGHDVMNTNEYFNFSDVSSERKWLADILQETNNSGPDDVQYKHILKLHVYSKRVRQGSKNINKYMHYGAGLISTVDQYKSKEIPSEVVKQAPEQIHKNFIRNDKMEVKSESRKRKRDSSLPPPVQSPLYPPNLLDDIADEPCLDLNLDATLDFHFEDEIANIPTSFDYTMPTTSMAPLSINTEQQSKKTKNKKFKDEEAKRKWEEMMTAKRKRFLIGIVKKEVGKQQRSKINRHKEMLIQCKKVAQQCAKVVRQKALYSARIMKEQQWRMKRLARENIAYWKRSRRIDREVKKRLEKEAEEQRKIDHELIEAKRQQRKLNFLITQTELYAHFMSKKLGQASPEEQLRILNQLDEEKNPKLANIDDYDSHLMKEMAMKNAEEAFLNERTRTKHFDAEANSSFVTNDEVPEGEHSQPQIFRGKLKGYQLKGMNWLANLYSQGISGILADEMGLGKTVQSIAFLCHVAEKYDVWGPFLIISPASTLHNWQQEIEKFVPTFKVVPYWGNPHERKILRQFWDQKDIYTKQASFHIVITSYQIVITDIKYFNRIKWQYMILDEAQAIKSTSSMRWKTLLGFSCRNRLLLSGTPIQNSMAELWALLHFIMPTLFDSHEEFNEWFSKDIESHAENKTGIDEKHLSRLHMILKPFMLRRIKKDVENELSDKIEIMVYCPLTTRQQLLYIALKQKIKIEDLIHYSVGGGDAHHVDKSFTSNLMNLVMQFRKVCNHPELFERRDAKSPISPIQIVYNCPRLIYHLDVRKNRFYLMEKYFLFSCDFVANRFQNDTKDTIFNFCLFLSLSFQELSDILQGNGMKKLKYFYHSERKDRLNDLNNVWNSGTMKPSIRIISHNSLVNSLKNSEIYNYLLFNSDKHKLVPYGFANYVSFSEARKKVSCERNDTIIDVVNEIPEFLITEYSEAPLVSVGFREATMSDVAHFVSYIPKFLFGTMPKVRSPLVEMYCHSRAAAWDHIRISNQIRFNTLTSFCGRAAGKSLEERQRFYPGPGLMDSIQPVHGWSSIFIPDKETLVTDAGKLSVLDNLLKKLKKEGHRVLIYSQMTKMIDLLEEYMWHRHHKYMRLDGSSKISERRDMVADFQARTDIFVFLLSTRAGGLGINLTAADTVIFYDSDWNPTVDQQAMDRAHRLGQTKQVTVYRLICKGTIEERILQRAREKNEIQKLVISGGNFKPDSLKPKEVVSLLLDEDELIQRVHKPAKVEVNEEEKKRKFETPFKTIPAFTGKYKTINPDTQFEDQFLNVDSTPTSPRSTTSNDILTDDLSDTSYFDDTDSLSNKYTVYNVYGSTVKPKPTLRGQSKRGRPRGSRSRTSLSRINTMGSSGSSSGIFSSSENNALESVTTGLNSNESQNITVGTRRGPGRPRLKPTGPANTSSRGTYKPRKPAKPLPVPIPSDPSSSFSVNQNTANSKSNLYSSYIFDFPEQDT